LAVAKLLADRQLPVDHTVAVLGSGAWPKAVVAALRDAGFHAGTLVARSAPTDLADQYGYAWRAEGGSSRPQLLVNATPVGMSGGPAAEDLPVAPEVVDSAETVFDVEQFLLTAASAPPTTRSVALGALPRIAQHQELPRGPLARCRTRLASPSGHGPHPDRARQALLAGSTVEPRFGSSLAVPAGLVGLSEPGNLAKGGEAS
jgi:hypothetical protein